MLKLSPAEVEELTSFQPPSGGCVLKQALEAKAWAADNQPPSGGCVLKQVSSICVGRVNHTAAFGRLCVETLGRWFRLRG